MEKLTLERLHAIAQIVVPPPRFFRLVDREKGMSAPDWQSCLEMATYCGLDISDFYACQCGCVMDRDHNAARNILSRGLSTVGHTGTFGLDPSNAWGVETATLVGANQSQQVTTRSQESPSSKPLTRRVEV